MAVAGCKGEKVAARSSAFFCAFVLLLHPPPAHPLPLFFARLPPGRSRVDCASMLACVERPGTLSNPMKMAEAGPPFDPAQGRVLPVLLLAIRGAALLGARERVCTDEQIKER